MAGELSNAEMLDWAATPERQRWLCGAIVTGLFSKGANLEVGGLPQDSVFDGESLSSIIKPVFANEYPWEDVAEVPLEKGQLFVGMSTPDDVSEFCLSAADQVVKRAGGKTTHLTYPSLYFGKQNDGRGNRLISMYDRLTRNQTGEDLVAIEVAGVIASNIMKSEITDTYQELSILLAALVMGESTPAHLRGLRFKIVGAKSTHYKGFTGRLDAVQPARFFESPGNFREYLDRWIVKR